MKRLLSFLLALALCGGPAFAQTKISQLPVAAPVTGTEAIPAVQGGVTVQTTPGAIAAYVQNLIANTPYTSLNISPTGSSQTPIGQILQTNSVGPPSWTSLSTIFDTVRFDMGGYPTSDEFGGNGVGIPSAGVGTINIPSNSNSGNAGFGLAGYAMSSSTLTGGVGVASFGAAAANGVSAWGGNDLVQNCLPISACATNTGNTNDTIYGREIDVNIYKSGGAAPNVAVRGEYIIGGSEVNTSSQVYYGSDIDSPGINLTPHLKWISAYRVEDGAAQAAFTIGTSDAGNSVGSQPILFNSRDGGGSAHQASIQSDDAGDIVVSPSSGALFSTPSGMHLPGIASSSAADTGSLCWNSTNGNVTVNESGTCLSSASKIKRRIEPLGPALREVELLKPVSYEYVDHITKKDEGRQIGLLAEDVEDVDQRLVSYDGKGELRGVRYEQMAALLIKGMQEQQAEIAALRAEVAHLKHRRGPAPKK